MSYWYWMFLWPVRNMAVEQSKLFMVLLVPTYMHWDGFWYVISRMLVSKPSFCDIITIKLLEHHWLDIYSTCMYCFPTYIFPMIWNVRCWSCKLLNLKTIDFCCIPGFKHQFHTVTSALARGEPMLDIEFFLLQQETVHLQPLFWTRQPHS